MDDTMVVDRGFRDIIDTFEQLGYEAYMPSYLQKNQTQHTTEEANNARLVTKVRWTVESHHARITYDAKVSVQMSEIIARQWE